jgi:hypothetical protein
MLASLLGVANQIGDRALVALLLGRLSNQDEFFDGWSLTCIGRHLAAAAAFLGDKAKAAEYNRQALEIGTKVRSRPEIAIIRLQMAELGLDNGDVSERAEAQAHLDFAIAEFRAMKLQPSLERALRLKDEG